MLLYNFVFLFIFPYFSCCSDCCLSCCFYFHHPLIPEYLHCADLVLLRVFPPPFSAVHTIPDEKYINASDPNFSVVVILSLGYLIDLLHT